MSAASVNVVIQTAFLGDLLLSIPLFKRCRELWPEEKLVLVCREKLGGFFLETGLVDEVLEIQKGKADTYRSIQQQLNSQNLIRVISPHTSLRTALFCRGLKAKKKISFRRPWNFFAFDTRVERRAALPDALRQLALLSPFDSNLAENLIQYERSARAFVRDEEGLLSKVPAWASMSLKDRIVADRGAWSRLMERTSWGRWEGKQKVLIFPGSVWATKRWTEEGFVEVGRELTAAGAQVIVMGAGNEVEISSRVAGKIPGAISLAGQTSLFETALLLAHSDLMIGNDSASIHLASATETPLISVFGPTVVEFGFRPWSDQAHIIEKKGLACRPCGPHGHMKCPRGTHECMKNLPAVEVTERAKAILN
jgi:heptosyltransferase-2